LRVATYDAVDYCHKPTANETDEYLRQKIKYHSTACGECVYNYALITTTITATRIT